MFIKIKNNFDKKEKNYLIVLASISIILLILLMLFFGKEKVLSGNIKKNISGSFYLFLIISLIIAPILEEIAFRGFFIKKKKLYFLSLFFFTFILVSSYSHFNLFLLITFVFIYFYLTYHKKDIQNKYLMIFNCFIFSIYHYKLDEITNIAQLTPALFQFAFACVTVWFVVNYSIKHSILVHFSVNFIPALIMFFYIQFPSEIKKEFKDTNVFFELEQIPYFNNQKSFIELSNKKIILQNIEIQKAVSLLGIDETSKYFYPNPYGKFNVKLKTKSDSKVDIKNEFVKRLMLEDLLIK